MNIEMTYNKKSIIISKIEKRGSIFNGFVFLIHFLKGSTHSIKNFGITIKIGTYAVFLSLL